MSATNLSSEEIESLIPIKDFAHHLGKARSTMMKYKDDGQMNHAKTRTVFLQMAWMPHGGWGCTRAWWDDFMRELQEN